MTEPWRHKIEWLHALARTPGVPPAVMRLAVLLTVYASSDPPFGRCHPAIQTLAADAGTTRAKVSERLRELRQNAWLTVVHQGGGQKSTTEYQLTPGAQSWRRYPYQPRLSIPATGTVEAGVDKPVDGPRGRFRIRVPTVTVPTTGTVKADVVDRLQSPSRGLPPSPPRGLPPSPPRGQEPCIEPGNEPGSSSMAGPSPNRHSADARDRDDLGFEAIT
jgi:hypothetical protein